MPKFFGIEKIFAEIQHLEVGEIFEKSIKILVWGTRKSMKSFKKWTSKMKFLISTQIERARSPRPGRVRRCCWVLLKGLSKRFWDFCKKKNWWSEIFSQLVGFSKKSKFWGIFIKIKIYLRNHKEKSNSLSKIKKIKKIFM